MGSKKKNTENCSTKVSTTASSESGGASFKYSVRPFVRVVAAVFRDGHQVLIARKREGKALAGYWEFPGGKLEKNESPEQALVREIEEELEVSPVVGAFIAKNLHSSGEIDIELSAYWVNSFSGEFQLKDHDSIEWVNESTWQDFKMAPADIPLIEKVFQELKLSLNSDQN